METIAIRDDYELSVSTNNGITLRCWTVDCDVEIKLNNVSLDSYNKETNSFIVDFMTNDLHIRSINFAFEDVTNYVTEINNVEYLLKRFIKAEKLLKLLK